LASFGHKLPLPPVCIEKTPRTGLSSREFNRGYLAPFTSSVHPSRLPVESTRGNLKFTTPGVCNKIV
jgi:hypothetical protein